MNRVGFMQSFYEVRYSSKDRFDVVQSPTLGICSNYIWTREGSRSTQKHCRIKKNGK